MRMAVAFLPCHMRQLMNLLASLELKRASGLRVSALAVRLRAMIIPKKSKSEYRNPRQIRSSKSEKVGLENVKSKCSCFDIRISNLFRISSFEFRTFNSETARAPGRLLAAPHGAGCRPGRRQFC